MAENRGYMQRYAMLFGTYMGGYWILKFTLFPLGLMVPFLLFLFAGLTVCVPFMGYYYTRMYRNHICGGNVSFLHAWLFTTFMYIFAALLTAVAHYVYFQFIDHGFVINTYEAMLDGFAQNNIPGTEAYINQLKDVMAVMQTLSPIDITMQMMSQNVIYGSLLAIPTALFAMRRKQEINNV